MMSDINSSILLTDLYMLTMLEGFHTEGMNGVASYEFFVRSLPPGRGFLMAAGLEQALQYLESAHFTAEELEWLRGTGRFSPAFVDSLATWRFQGDMEAMPEGTVFFPNEPIVRITAPISQAQLVESRLINIFHYQTLIASKAARCVLAAPGKLLVDFGLRRAHGAEAGLLAARACYLAGFHGTATVLAGKRFGIPTYGTMAHAYVLAHASEEAAFESFAQAQPENVVLLIDTYDTEEGARTAVKVAPRLRQRGIAIKAVRLDSGDLAALSVKVRRILDEGGLQETGIFCSGDLEELSLQKLVQAGAPINGFGVGTRLDTSYDVPYLNCAYKLVEYEGIPRRKRSAGKASWPARKQVFRRYGDDRVIEADTITLADDSQPGEPLLQPFMRAGRRLQPAEELNCLRERAAHQLSRLPENLRALGSNPPLSVGISPALEATARRIDVG
jgi:nicotinate phosphoribosyltransferase